MLTEDDEEIEIVPHVKGSSDFEVYESVVIKPRETLLPWDDNVKPVYDLKYAASGGGKTYKFTTSDETLATVNNEGKATTHSGPGSFTVRAAMIKGEANYDEATVRETFNLREKLPNFVSGISLRTLALFCHC